MKVLDKIRAWAFLAPCHALNKPNSWKSFYANIFHILKMRQIFLKINFLKISHRWIPLNVKIHSTWHICTSYGSAYLEFHTWLTRLDWWDVMPKHSLISVIQYVFLNQPIAAVKRQVSIHCCSCIPLRMQQFILSSNYYFEAQAFRFFYGFLCRQLYWP